MKSACFVRLRALALLFLLAGSATVSAQPLSTPDLRITSDGDVFSAARLPDGGYIVGGNFRWINGVARTNLARLAEDGAVDEAWHPETDAPVTSVLTLADGAVVVGGHFTRIDGRFRYLVARLLPSGALDLAWNPALREAPTELERAPDGSIYAAGWYAGSVGQPVRGVERILPEGVIDAAWGASVLGRVASVEVDAAGAIYIAGSFTEVEGQSRDGVARIFPADGTLDTEWAPQFDSEVSDIIARSAHVFVAGRFWNVDGQPRRYLARLSAATGRLDPTWTSGLDAEADKIVIDEDGRMYVASGSLIDGVISRLSTTTGALDPQWQVSYSGGSVAAMLVRPSGGLLVAGTFDTVAGQERFGLAATEADGPLAPAIDAEALGVVHATARQADGGRIVGGHFRRVSGHSRNHLMRLTPAGNLDPFWAPISSWQVSALAVASDGSIMVGGGFSRIDGVIVDGLAKLEATNPPQVDEAWRPSVAGSVVAIASLPDDSLAVVSSEYPTHRLFKVAVNGSGDAVVGWGGRTDGTIYALHVAASGATFIGGDFSSIDGRPRKAVAKWTTDGLLDATWAPVTDATRVGAIASDLDGRLYLGGNFEHADGHAHDGILRMEASGVVDHGWVPTLDVDAERIVVDGDSAVYAAGPQRQLFINGADGLQKISLSKDGAGYTLASDGYILSLESDREAGGLFVGGSHTRIAESARLALAAFPLGPYVLSYAAGSNGALIGVTRQLVAFDGDASDVTAIPDLGYEFVSWSDGSIANPRRDVDVRGHAQVIAQFAALPVVDVRVEIDNHATQLRPSESTSYRVVLSNAGVNDVSGVRLLVGMSTGLEYGSWRCDGQASTQACTEPSEGVGGLEITTALAAGKAQTFVVSAQVAMRATGQVSTSASASIPPRFFDLDSDNDSAIDIDPIDSELMFGSGFEVPR